MSTGPIWKDTYYESQSDTLSYELLNTAGTVIHQAYTKKMPGTTGVTLNINNKVDEYLKPDFDTDFTVATNNVIKNSDAYKSYGLYRDTIPASLLETYDFLYDWTYGEDWTGQTKHNMSEPIRHMDPRMKAMFTIFNTAQTDFNWEIEFTPYVTIIPQYINFNSTGGSITVTITSNYNWTMTSNPDWISADVTAGTGSFNSPSTTTVTLTATSNEGNPNQRNGSIAISNGEGITYLYVSQDYDYDVHNAPHLSLYSITLDGNEHTFNLTVSSETPWTVMVKPDWVTVEPSSSTKKVKTVVVDVDAYLAMETTSRTGTVLIQNTEGYQAELSITQSSMLPYLIVTPTQMDFDYYDDSSAITIFSITGWTVSSKPEWVTVSPASGESGYTYGTLSVQENMTSSNRNGEVVISNSYTSVTVTVTQLCFVGIIAYYKGTPYPYENFVVASGISNYRLMQVEGERPKTPSNYIDQTKTSPYYIRWALKTDKIAPDNYSFSSINGDVREEKLIGIEFRCPEISEGVVSSCTELTSVTFNYDFYVQDNCPKSAFAGCTSLPAFNAPGFWKTINDYSFISCQSLARFDSPYALETICNYSFAHCYGMTVFNCSDALKTIGNYTFYHSSGLTAFNFGTQGNLTKISDYAMSYTGPMSLVALPEGLLEIGNHCFEYSMLYAVTFPSTLEVIRHNQNDGYNFANCNNLSSVVIDFDIPAFYYNYQPQWGSGQEYWVLNTFVNCTGLTGVTLINGVTDRSQDPLTMPHLMSTFKGCTSLVSIDSSNLKERIHLNGTFQGCTSLTDVTLTETMSIGGLSFEDCISLSGVTIDNGVTLYISNNAAFWYIEAFKNTAIESITIPDSIPIVQQPLSFINCTSLTGITFPSTFEIVGPIFSGCTSLRDIDLTNCTRIYGEDMFAQTLIEHITIPATVTGTSILDIANAINIRSITALPSPMSTGIRTSINNYCCGSLTSRISYASWMYDATDWSTGVYHHTLPNGWINTVVPDYPV